MNEEASAQFLKITVLNEVRTIKMNSVDYFRLFQWLNRCFKASTSNANILPLDFLSEFTFLLSFSFLPPVQSPSEKERRIGTNSETPSVV